MKVLTVGANNASTQNNTIMGLRALGVEVKGISFESQISIYSDYSCISLPNLARGSNKRLAFSWWMKKFLSAFLFLKHVRWADIIHCYSYLNLLPLGLDFLLLKAFRKPGVIEFQGSDIRVPATEMANNPFFIRAFSDPEYEYPDEAAAIHASLSRQRRFASLGFHAVVSAALPLLNKSFFPSCSIVFHPSIVRNVCPIFPLENKKGPVVIAHAPSAPVAKGTKYIVKAIENLKRMYEIEFVLINNIPLRQALELIEKCDIYVDQMIWGGYGIAAQQAMALGKPVVCYLKPVLMENLYPDDIPLVNANVDNLEEKLGDLIREPILRHKIGIRSRDYVERYHDHIRVAENLIKVYNSVLSSHALSSLNSAQ